MRDLYLYIKKCIRSLLKSSLSVNYIPVLYLYTCSILYNNYTRILRAILNKSWRQHPTKQQLYGHLPLITKTVQVRRTRHARHCWRSREELIRDVLLWTPSHGQTKAGRPARTYREQLCANTGCSPEDLPEAMDDREGWWERVRDIHTDGGTWWRWWFQPETKTLTRKLEIIFCPVSRGCSIHRLLLCRGVRPPSNDCPGYDTKQSDGEVPAILELWGMRSTPLLPLLPDPLGPRVVALDRALSMG